MAADNSMANDKESCNELEQVRKGKTRKFVLLCKGPAIVSLVVYKKGSVEKFKKQAKESGTGQIYFGIVEGPAPEVKFKLAAADGFDKDPVKPLALKQYLEEAGFKFKPVFELVELHPPVLDEDDPLVQRYLKLREAATAAGKVNADRAKELNSLCDEIAKLLDQDQDEAAKAKLTALEALLGALSGGAKGASDVAATDADSEMVRFTSRLKVLKQDLDDLNDMTTPEGLEAKQITDQLPTLVKQKAFAEGNQALDRVEKLLDIAEQAITGKPPIPPPPPGMLPPTPPDRKLAASLRSLGPDLTQLTRAYPERKEEVDKLKAAIDLCLKSGKYDEGDQLVARLQKLVASLGSVEPAKAAEFREPWAMAKQVWEEAVADVRDQMVALQNGLMLSDDDELAEIGEFGLNAVTQDHLVPIRAAFMEIDAAGADRLKTAAKQLQNLVVEFRKHVSESPKVKACEKNPLEIPVAIGDTLEPGFDALENGLNFITAG